MVVPVVQRTPSHGIRRFFKEGVIALHYLNVCASGKELAFSVVASLYGPPESL